MNNLPNGTTSADIDNGCLRDGLMHCELCNDVVADHESGLCVICRPTPDEED